MDRARCAILSCWPWQQCISSERISGYGEAAKAKGVCIVSFAGYDCVPFEMSAYLAHRALSTTNNTQLVSAESLTTLSGGLPRGTLLTCVGMPGLGLLRVNTNWMRYLPSTERLSFARDVLLWALPWWSYQSGGLTIPEGMGMVACTIVHHSAPKLGYPNLRYNSRTDVLGSSIAFCQISGTISMKIRCSTIRPTFRRLL